MKKYLLVAVMGSMIVLTACNNNSSADSKTTIRTKADTLYDEVMDGHDVGMGKMGALTRAEQQVSRMIDSIEKLPSKAREAAMPYKAKLSNLGDELKHADSSMNKWMEDFNLDSAMNNTTSRLNYLVDQKDKVTKVKSYILKTLGKADSVLKKKF